MTRYDHLRIEADRGAGTATIVIAGPDGPPASLDALHADGAAAWPLAVVRELDDAILTLRANERGLGTWLLKSEGDPAAVTAVSDFLLAHRDDWLVNEIIQFWKRTVRRLDATSRSLFALIEPGSCFAGPAAGGGAGRRPPVHARGHLHATQARQPAPAEPAVLRLDEFSLGLLPTASGLTRLAVRFCGRHAQADLRRGPRRRRPGPGRGRRRRARAGHRDARRPRLGRRDAAGRRGAGQLLPRRADRHGGQPPLRRPETCETKIFGRLSAWQNWIFQRPNAAGPAGALRRYGTGQRADYDRKRV